MKYLLSNYSYILFSYSEIENSKKQNNFASFYFQYYNVLMLHKIVPEGNTKMKISNAYDEEVIQMI